MNSSNDTDVLIIGFGGAGAVAAISAHDAGANVLLVEKMPEGGGNTNVSLGGFLSLKDYEQGLLYLKHLCGRILSTVDPDMLEVFAKACVNNTKWIENFGAKTHVYGKASFPMLPGADSVEKRMITGKNTAYENSFWHFLRNEVGKRNIPVMYNAAAESLTQNTNGTITGAVINQEGKTFHINASKAVILTCGGFEYNDWMKKNYLKGYPYHALGTPANTGEGLKMAQQVGADIWHASNVSAPLGFKSPDFDAAFLSRPASNQFIYIDKNGKRFASEVTDIHAYNYLVDFFDPQRLDFPRIPCFMIFDESVRQAGPVALSSIGYNRGRYQWSKDNSDELRRGWITSGKTPSELAAKIGIDPHELNETIKRYNRFCNSGNDDDYYRPKDKLALIDTTSLYAIKLWPCLLNTQGGPRRNKKAQVLYPDGKPIPHLYSAGELGSIFGLLYQGAGNLGECLAFGRIAGKQAADEKPWR